MGTAQRLVEPGLKNDVLVAGSSVSVSDCVKIVGVTLDSRLNFDMHVTNVCAVARFHIQALRHIRPVLNCNTAAAIARGTVLAKLDYCNGLLAGVKQNNIDKIQRVQNYAARVVCQKPRRDNALSLLKELHWLPIKQRIDFKIALTTFKVLTSGQPSYLYDLIKAYNPARSLRSSSQFTLTVPPTKTNLHSRAFEVYAPRLWNSLPVSIREAIVLNISTDCFKSRLKLAFFAQTFCNLA